LEDYSTNRKIAAEQQRFFCWHGIAPFECIHPVCGHEYMLMGMAMDPEWVSDMVTTYATVTIQIMEELFAKAGKPDGVWFYEDMGFKGRPFMSPEMYMALVQPGHKILFDYAHSQGLKVIVHSCGFVEPLVPGLVAAGMDCLQAMEVKAGMDVLRLAEQFGDRIAFCGNLDVRELISNDFGRIDAEMDRKIPELLKHKRGFIVHTDHSVPPQVDFASMRHWYERARSYH
jgi:uroporphyrinogen decarboxylase